METFAVFFAVTTDRPPCLECLDGFVSKAVVFPWPPTFPAKFYFSIGSVL